MIALLWLLGCASPPSPCVDQVYLISPSPWTATGASCRDERQKMRVESVNMDSQNAASFLVSCRCEEATK